MFDIVCHKSCYYIDCCHLKYDKVCLVVLVIIVTLFLLLQTEFAEDDDPGIQITYADETKIHNCLGLPSISTVGPPDVPITLRGCKS